MTARSPKLFRRQIVEAARAGAPAEPACRHAPPAGECGGCTFQARTYEAQVAAKQAAMRELWAGDLSPAALESLDVVASPLALEYRTRMDYVCSKGRFGLRRGGSYNYIVDLHECRLIPEAAFGHARGLHAYASGLGLPDYNLRSHEGFLRYIVVRRSPQGSLLLAFVTAAPDEAGEQELALAEVAADALADPAVVGVHWLVNDTVTDVSFGQPRRHWGAATLPMQVGARTLQIGPNTFFQNNVALLLPLLDEVAELACDGLAGPLADLYGGVGTIALHLAGGAPEVVTVESVAESAELARRNALDNGCANVESVCADTLAYLRSQPAGRFDVVVADPPRTGLGPEVCAELIRLAPRRIVYVSCNTLTLLEDTRALAPAFATERLRGYDMFPQTPHLEALALLTRR